MTNPIRLLLVDDHDLVRAGIARLQSPAAGSILQRGERIRVQFAK